MRISNGVLPSNTLNLSSLVSKTYLFDSNLFFKQVFLKIFKKQPHAINDQIYIIPQG